MEQKILSLKDDGIRSEVELFEYPEELRGGRNLLLNSNFDTSSFNGYSSIYGVQAVNGGIYKKTFTQSVVACRVEKVFNLNVIGVFTFTLRIKVTSTVTSMNFMAFEGLTASTKIYDITGDWQIINCTFKNNTAGSKIIRLYIHSSGIGDTVEIDWEKLEKGTTPTLWTPAPEDLNLSYPDFITEFKPSISDKYILTEELIEGQPTSFSNKITTNEFIEQ